MKTCLVTGGSGFIGSWLCKLLLEMGYRVICLDNLITGNINNISNIIKNPRFSFIKRDIINNVKIDENLDFVFHLASPASPIHYQKYKIKTLLVNSIGTYNILKLASKKGAKVLYASSSEVYGEPKIHPQKEDYWGNVNPVGPRSCYDEGKRFSESLISAFNLDGSDTTIVRKVNTYGPFMNKNDGRVIPNFINQAINNLPVTIYGNGNQTRSFCYITDTIDGLQKVMFSDNTNREILNIGNSNEISIIYLAEKIIELTNSSSKIVFRDLPLDDPSRRRPDISKANRLVSWQPKITIDDGIKKTIDYFIRLQN